MNTCIFSFFDLIVFYLFNIGAEKKLTFIWSHNILLNHSNLERGNANVYIEYAVHNTKRQNRMKENVGAKIGKEINN